MFSDRLVVGKFIFSKWNCEISNSYSLFFFALLPTVEAMKRGGVRSKFLSNCDNDNSKHKTSIYHCARHDL